MKEMKLSDRISYVECSEEPLSADIGIIRDQGKIWLYDVGNDAGRIEGFDRKYHIVLSHFHADHVGNLERMRIETLYLSKETQKHVVPQGLIVEDDLYIDDIHIFPLRSSHAKGCLGLEVNETYAFVGDALYGREKNGRYGYNTQLLREEIDQLMKLKAPYLLVSHYPGLVRNREEVIGELEEKWRNREGDFCPM